VSFFTIGSPHERLVVTARSRVRVAAPALPDASRTPGWEQVRQRCASNVLTPDSAVGEFCFDSPYITRQPAFADYAAASFPKDRPLLEGVIDLTGRIHRDFKFDPRATTVATPLDEVFKKRRGVCQDFAHFAIAGLRSLGLPARYVSGYLETQPPLGKARLVGADASHAWFAVWCPGHGWIDADPTNNLLPGERHITVAWGRDFSDVSPVRGVVVGGGDHGVGVGVDVVRVE
jgi:transglutaminase-like putative cysteine protease